MLNKRKITTIYVDEELKNKALSLGINLSGWFNTKLKEVVEILEGNNTREYEPCGGRDLNPRIPTEPDPQSGTFDLARQPPPTTKGIHFIYPFSIKGPFLRLFCTSSLE